MLEDANILQHSNAGDSPIPLPKGSESHETATVLLNRKMKEVIEYEAHHYDPVNQFARHLRVLFFDLIEPLEPDGLDLYLIVK